MMWIMKSLSGHGRFPRLGAFPGGGRRGVRARARRSQPLLDELEGRMVLSTLSAITSSFNGTAIPAGDTVWFSSVAKVRGVGSAPVTLRVVDQTISFTANGVAKSLSVPDTVITVSPTSTTASTTFNTATDTWQTAVPAALSGNVFLGGMSFQPAGGLPGGIKNVTWSGEFSTDTPGVSVNWQWAAAVYSRFSTDNGSLNVKPVDDSRLSAYHNSDHAGTPEVFKKLVVGGARGGGGSNYTGSYSGTAAVAPDVETVATTASLSGHVFAAFGVPIAGVQVVLTGADDQGNSVTRTATTDDEGAYIFNDLRAGIYTVQRPPLDILNVTSVGTVDGESDGETSPTGDIIQIVLAGGDQGIDYDFRQALS